MIWEKLNMNKSVSLDICVSEEDFYKLLMVAKLESYSSYSEFIRRTALL